MRLENGSAQKEIEQILAVCGELGVDGEMTALVLGSHRRDRDLAGPMFVDIVDLTGYVRRKLAVWKAILEGPIE